MTAGLAPHQREFIALALACNALKFGQFRLKSGRISPYFFNAGTFHTGAALAALGRCYAAAIAESDLAFALLFGPAYKGIPLVAATAIALSEQHRRDLPYCFNRKEVKDHGEGGTLVGAPLRGRVLIIDDVITAGTAIRDVMALLAAHGAEPAGVLIGLDRQERGPRDRSAIAEVEATYGIPVISIVTIRQIIDYLTGAPELAARAPAIVQYLREFGT